MSEPRDVMRGPVLVAMCTCSHERWMHLQGPCRTLIDRDPPTYCSCDGFAYSDSLSERISLQNLEHGLEVQRRMFDDA